MKIKNDKYLNIIMLLVCWTLSTPLCAQQFDQSYLKWKAKQQQIDAKLKSNDANYYLSKPTVGTAKSTSVGAAKAQNLAATSTKIRINSANITELQQLNGVGEKKAQAILEYRDQNGKFKNIDELQNIKGIGPKLIEKNRARLSL